MGIPSLNIFRRGKPDSGRDQIQQLDVPPNSRGFFFDNFGNPYFKHLLHTFDCFDLLPVITTVVATSAKYCLVVGTNAVSADVTQSTTGGASLATHGASGDSTLVAGVAATGWALPITATNLLAFRTRVMLASIASVIVSAGLNGTRAAADIDPTNAAGEGACFLFDPGVTVTTGLPAAAQQNNWILCMKVAGADTFIDSGVPVVANRDYDLRIVVGTDLKPVFYIDEVKIAVGAAAHTSGQTEGILIGIKATTAAVKTLHVRYASLGRAIG